MRFFLFAGVTLALCFSASAAPATRKPATQFKAWFQVDDELHRRYPGKATYTQRATAVLALLQASGSRQTAHAVEGWATQTLSTEARLPRTPGASLGNTCLKWIRTAALIKQGKSKASYASAQKSALTAAKRADALNKPRS